MTAPRPGVVKTSDDSVTDAALPPFPAVTDALRDAGSPADAAEAHGSLCGLCCALGEAAATPAWLSGTLGVSPAAGATVLAELASATGAALTADDLRFAPLLPGDAEPLALRVRRLAEWCHGFTCGLADGAACTGADLEGELLREVLGDFGQLARAAVGDDGDEGGEAAYAELVEFVRVSVQLVFDELATSRGRSGPPVRH